METVRRGVPISEQKWKGHCTCCKPSTIALATATELHITHNQRDGSFGVAPCPVGGKQMYFYEVDQNDVSRW